MMAGQFFTALGAELSSLKEAENTGNPVIPPKQGFFRNLLRYLMSVLRRVWAQG
jgi:hypothetical protein